MSAEVLEWREKLADTRNKFADIDADHNGRVLLTSDGLSNGYLKNGFLQLLGKESIPKDLKALVLMDSSRFRAETKESFTDNLESLGWPKENIDSINLIDKDFIPAKGKVEYTAMVEEAKGLYDMLMKGESPKEKPQIVYKLRQESERLNTVHKAELDAFLAKLETYDLICGNGGDVVIANFALMINPQVTKKMKELIRSGKTAYMGRSAGSMVATKTMRLSGEVTDDFATIFLGDDDGTDSIEGAEGGLCVFHAPIAFRPHYTDKQWGNKVKAENADTTDEGGVVFVPVKNGEGILLTVDENKMERLQAVIRRNSIVDEMDHILNYLPRADLGP
jgi:hypothetical protein